MSHRTEPLSLDDDPGILARSLNVLRAIAHAASPLSNAEIAALTGLPKATVSRITTRLMVSSLVRQPRGTDHFALGPGVLELSRAFLDRLDVRAVFRDVMPSVVETLGSAAHMGLRDHLDMVLLDTVQPRAATLVTRLRAGSRMTLATSAMGKAYLCALPPSERQSLIRTLQEVGQLRGSTLQESLQLAQEELTLSGFCTSFGEWNPEINAIATYIHAPDGEIYGVSCGGSAYQLSANFLMTQAVPLLREAVQEICRETGATTAFPVNLPG